ncbi:MAG: VanW family protein [Peptococcaceae bacterium]|nr:VanW family protein [Peptococcaceae bacterium]
MKRKLFCEISPLTYTFSTFKGRTQRSLQDYLSKAKFAGAKGDPLPIVLYKHNSLIRRQLGNVDMHLQENKAINLSLAAPLVDRVLLYPGETFSFWHLVGNCTKARGYQEGLTISADQTKQGVGGGMCQFTNLLHWLVLHSPLDIIEHHHHNQFDLFPDYGRQVPFGCGTSIVYNYLDYRVKNNTDNTFQFLVTVSPTHLEGELRAAKPIAHSYHIIEKDSCFEQRNGTHYRRNKIFRNIVDKQTGVTIESRLIMESDAKVMYDIAT